MKGQQKGKLENQQDWAQIFRLLPVQILIIDRNGLILYLNRTLSGINVDDVVGTNVSDYVPQKDKKEFSNLMTEAMESGKSAKAETSLVLPDWSERWLQYYIIPMKRNGRIHELAMVALDITEVKTAEESLRDSENKFRALSEKSPNMIFINRGSRIIYANPICVQTMGFSCEELYSEEFKFLQLIAPESVPAVQENFVKYMLEEEVEPAEYSLITKSGEKLEVIISTRLIPIENKIAVLGIVTDITDRKNAEELLKKAKDNLEQRVKKRTEELTETTIRLERQIDQLKKTEAALRTSQARLRSIFDSSPDAITVTDLTANIVDCNRAALEQSRFATKQELCQKNALDLFVEEDVPRAMRNMEIILQKGIIRDIEYRLLRKDGTEYPASASVSVIKDTRGQVSGFVAVTSDISERKKSESMLLDSQFQLQEEKNALEQKVTALGDIIARYEIDKLQVKEHISSNVRQVIFPILDRLTSESGPGPLLDLLRDQLERVTSNFGAKISEKRANLTSREIEICQMIKGGLSSNNVAQLLHISPATVDRHRKNIRRKLQLTNKSMNLETFLKAMD